RPARRAGVRRGGVAVRLLVLPPVAAGARAGVHVRQLPEGRLDPAVPDVRGQHLPDRGADGAALRDRWVRPGVLPCLPRTAVTPTPPDRDRDRVHGELPGGRLLVADALGGERDHQLTAAG